MVNPAYMMNESEHLKIVSELKAQHKQQLIRAVFFSGLVGFFIGIVLSLIV